MCGQVAEVTTRTTNAIDALVKRINRKMQKATDGSANLKLRKALPKVVSTFGQFYLQNLATGEIVTPYVKASELARQFDVSTEGIRFEGGFCSGNETAYNVAA